MSDDTERDIVKYKPFSLFEEFDETFRNFRRNLNNFLFKDPLISPNFPRMRPLLMDIKDIDGKYVLEAEIPGIKKENITVEINNNFLQIKGEEKIELKKEKEGYIRKEIGMKSFYRKIILPPDAKQEKIDAKLSDGILTIEIPKEKSTLKKQIDIQ